MFLKLKQPKLNVAISFVTILYNLLDDTFIKKATFASTS
jgi:hypothetical protein